MLKYCNNKELVECVYISVGVAFVQFVGIVYNLSLIHGDSLARSLPKGALYMHMTGVKL